MIMTQNMEQIITKLHRENTMRELCKVTKSKIFREIAGSRVREWETLYIVSFKDLRPEKLKTLTHTADCEYFHARWMRLRAILDIKENEKLLQRMYDNCVENDYVPTIGVTGGVKIAMTAFLDYNQKISKIRSESMYQCMWNLYCME